LVFAWTHATAERLGAQVRLDELTRLAVNAAESICRNVCAASIFRTRVVRFIDQAPPWRLDERSPCRRSQAARRHLIRLRAS
jgi:hypothetical protein